MSDRSPNNPLSELEARLESQEVELSLLRKPGVRLATRKLLGAIRRRVTADLRGGKSKIKKIANKHRSKNSVKRKDGVTATICVYNNFGNILQRFALLKFLKNNGLNFDSFDMLDVNSGDVGPVNQNFVKFADKYISSVDFDDNKNAYKKYIVGSDRIWRPKHLRNQVGGVGSFLLDFLNDRRDIKRIAYGASFGFGAANVNEYAEMATEKNKSLLRKFSAISVRESSAVEVIKNMVDQEITTEMVVDPTMLLGRDEYDQIIDSGDCEDTSSPEVFYFIFDNTPRYESVIRDVENSFQRVVSEWPSSVEGWLRFVRDANLIVAGSFHAIVFSIIFNTDFVLIESDDEPNERVRNLLSTLGIGNDRIINSKNYKEFRLKNLKPIEWDNVNSRIDDLAKSSGDWLLRQVGES